MSIPRSIESVLAVWAVAKTGAAFVPVDPNYPSDRVAYMIEDSGVSIGLTVGELGIDLPSSVRWIAIDSLETTQASEAMSGEPVAYSDRVRTLRTEHPAYVIYTSGSTGRPKGVVVTHAGLGNLLSEQAERLGATAQSRFCISPPPASILRSSSCCLPLVPARRWLSFRRPFTVVTSSRNY